MRELASCRIQQLKEPMWLRRFDRSLAGIPSDRCRRFLYQCLCLVLLSACVLFPATARASHSGSLSSRINAILHSTAAGRGFWGIEVVRLPDGRLLYARNARHLFQPASNLKLFTAAAALSKLGPGFIFRTTVESSAPPDAEGRVPSLILVGRGDPNLGSRVLPYCLKARVRSPADADFAQLADQVVAKGIREVTGDIVADDSYYVDQPYGPDWAIDDIVWGYGAPITALAFNDNSLKLHVRPGSAVGAPAQITLGPVSNYYMIKNRVKTASSRTRAKVLVERAPGSTELDVWGRVPLDSTGIDEDVAIQSPPRLIGEMFRRLLEQRGVKVDGQVVVRQKMPYAVAAGTGPVPEPQTRYILAEHDSLPLSDDIKVMLKVSQNLHAEMLLRTMARQLTGQGSLEAGIKILDDFAQKINIPPAEVSFADGSGLSRYNLVTPDALIKLLGFMAGSRYFKDFYDALPVAGVDGTLADRFENTVVSGRIHAKTGSMEHVNALSGYMDLPAGDRLAFVIVANDYAVSSAVAAKTIDRIALTIYREFADGRKVR
ncbi:MAG: D-alanyl-D-alanine carboxypeptidase/D-alanyl-D-alanine-endopeptidase [Acidobacteria bacterium]|nr:D-alanyl-D-alanine carboxypeptidase/D-alanyl-D-alanine-endopeptidase [Acidobacteriota bacterium]